MVLTASSNRLEALRYLMPRVRELIPTLQPGFRAAYESLRHEVDNDPNLEEDLRVSIALALGGTQQGGGDFQRTVNEYLNDRPELVKPHKSLLRLHWSAFSKLTLKPVQNG